MRLTVREFVIKYTVGESAEWQPYETYEDKGAYTTRAEAKAVINAVRHKDYNRKRDFAVFTRSTYEELDSVIGAVETPTEIADEPSCGGT